MKSMLVIITFIIFSATTFAQEVIVQDTVLPEKVLKGFTKKCPKATSEDWMQEGSNYIISYFDDNKWYDVTFGSNGKWIETAIVIDYEKLPESIINHFESSKYNEFEVVKITVSEKPKTENIYRIYVESLDMKETILQYNESGKLLSFQ
ncbi:MAG: hypothetical protein HOD63_12530 [Bacteroidetes bacterium]|jgi:hypothetical protein|nr:hypothetical protein [Bacteroidota bacterium]MBT3423811.1 hypothetical protein [Bacteroidota bacterium]MBT3800437.1 hypothetical protein [Bacteroidota bacterium]MBT4339411.1 hypothetical protein [Bacteroidota bacterium]MBT4969968.1 hypothetical protein [Bacteroidota bacterium]